VIGMLPRRVDVDLVSERIGPYADPRATREERGEIYQQLLGFVPPRIEARLAVTGALTPTVLDLQEQLRAAVMYPSCFDTRTAQLMLFGMLLMDLNDAAQLHAIAARRAGATWEELQATVNLCFLFRGLSAANRGAEIIARVAEHEHQRAGEAP
jgi:alkylhydroperoxidase/carboxymuconolactone decarboxylase family protein YurZ